MNFVFLFADMCLNEKNLFKEVINLCIEYLNAGRCFMVVTLLNQKNTPNDPIV